MALVARNTHLFEQIHGILWDKILSGEIRPTQRLKDIEWAKKLGVSRTPVREAMRKMQQEGILTPLDTGGYELRAVSLDDLYGLYRCRSALEVQAVRDAAPHFGPKAAKQLGMIINMTSEAIEQGDFDKVLRLNTDFHGELIRQSQNVHLINLCNSIQKLILFYRCVFLSQVKSKPSKEADYVDRLLVKQSEHESIISALNENDGEKAGQLMADHLLVTAQHMSIDT